MFRRERGNSFAIYVTFAAFSFVLRMIIGRKLTMLNLKMDTLSLDGEFRDEEHFLKPYNKVRHSFDNEYDRANPVTAEEKTKEYLRWIFGKLSQTDYLFAFSKNFLTIFSFSIK